MTIPKHAALVGCAATPSVRTGARARTTPHLLGTENFVFFFHPLYGRRVNPQDGLSIPARGRKLYHQALQRDSTSRRKPCPSSIFLEAQRARNLTPPLDIALIPITKNQVVVFGGLNPTSSTQMPSAHRRCCHRLTSQSVIGVSNETSRQRAQGTEK